MNEDKIKSHFQNTDIVKFKLHDGSEFGYRPMTAGEENDYMKDYMVHEKYITDSGTPAVRRVEDITKINKVKSYNLVEAPYQGWEKMSKEERWDLMCKLKPGILSEIIQNIKKIDSGDTPEKKNLSETFLTHSSSKSTSNQESKGSTG